MEILYLLFITISTTLISFALSILIPLRVLLTRLLRFSDSNSVDHVSFYQGVLWHGRRHPVRHSFRYFVRYALFDLDKSPNPPPDHLSADEARRIAQTAGPVFLLTIPPSVGYQENPLSVYYCYDLEDNLVNCIAEVTNTPWGERVTFAFNPNLDLVPKTFHVSPYMDMLGKWRMSTKAPGENLFLKVSVEHPEFGNYFVATLKAKKIPSSMVSDQAYFFWLMPHKVAIWIYWNAVQLWWKNVEFKQHPKYSDPNYMETVLQNQKPRCCYATDKDFADRNCEKHQFKFRAAQWPL
ncbi:uncharacterized protein LOC126682585 [Mercurialis annua]|uniref:uncharacterized protein LOC126682585 n=1 Tax=Mercurialis annua TaxID=3986 RepID=UPI0021606B94|nr:uncharacterized protein LOC126682585 [Mercurialis annua]